jgi:hypothetical protein
VESAALQCESNLSHTIPLRTHSPFLTSPHSTLLYITTFHPIPPPSTLLPPTSTAPHFQLQERYLTLRSKILACAPSDPSGDFPTQLSKLAAGVLTDRYAQPEDRRCYTFSLSVIQSLSVSLSSFFYGHVYIHLSIPPSLFLLVTPLSSSLSRPINRLVASLSVTYILIFSTLFVTFSRLHPTLLCSTVLLR